MERLTGETLPQQIRRWQELYSPQHEVIHQFPNNWTIRNNLGDEPVRRIGEMMRNCWQGVGPEDIEGGPFTGEVLGREKMPNAQWMSLHDEHGIPRIAFYMNPDSRQIHEPLGMRNMTPHPNYSSALAQWAEGEGLMFNNRKYQPIHPDEWSDSTREFYEDQYHPEVANPEFHQANILDPIHDVLAPEVWDNPGDPRPHLKEHHRKWIMRELYSHASEFEANPEEWLTLVLTGSLTTYQYSQTSDCDVSLFVDPFKLPEWSRGKLIGLMVAHLDGVKLPGTPYQMQGFVVAKGISKADLYQPGLRSGYDILTEQWVVPPDPSRSHDVAREQNADYIYALESADKMERLLRYEPSKAVQYWHQIHKRRMRDQSAGKGDYSQANIVYKFLSNRNLFPGISEASGEYIAKTSARVIYRKFQPSLDHAPGPDGPEMPFVYNPDSGIVHLGPINSFHWELINREPELKAQYPGEGWNGAPFLQNSNHVHGRMTWPGKVSYFYGQPHPDIMNEVNTALGATTKPVEPIGNIDWDD